MALDEKKPTELEAPQSFKGYEDGKHRRYNLLFAVNGGAFAVAQLFADYTGKEAAGLLGNLTIDQLSFGMIIFTIVMTFDIYMFGKKMHKYYLPRAFGLQGKVVLLMIGFLICAGWFLVAAPFDQLFL